MNSCLEQRGEPFDACLNKFWVDSDELGLGFVREEKRERKEERERAKKMNEPGCFPFYISTRTGLIQTRSILLCFQPFDLDPDGSGSIQRFWSVMEIRIHQVCGFGPGSVGLSCLFSVLLNSLLIAPIFLLPVPLCVLSFLPKNS